MTITILQGDSLERLQAMDSDSVDCVVTSPPYWGLRDYGVVGQMGLEPSLKEHLDAMVILFREVRRVLKPSGTCWVNYGDCYASHPNGRPAALVENDDRKFCDKPFSTVGPIDRTKRNSKRWGGGKNPASGTLKPKDLCMVPNRLAIALQDDGWWIRSEIIWSKPNPMPDSAKDRPAVAHEKIFLLTKSSKYFYDAEAVRQPSKKTPKKQKVPDGWDTLAGAHGSVHRAGRNKESKQDKQRGHSRRHAGFNDRWDQMTKEEQTANGHNLRNVWEVATRRFEGAHFATFPMAIPLQCIRAGCPQDGVVLDIFGGAGTTCLAAHYLGRDSIMIELNPEYIEIAENRFRDADSLTLDLKKVA